jgi:DNA-binding FrmR family transcriptional regulator
MGLLSVGIGNLPVPPNQDIPQAVFTSTFFGTYFYEKMFSMAHTAEEKKRLLNRVRRIMGQVAAIQRALEQESDCSDVLHNISACRGAMDALMAEVIEGHIRYHVLAPNGAATDEQQLAADDLVAALRAYLR